MGSRKIFITSLTTVSDTDVEGLGTVRQEGAKWYKWVVFTTGSGPVAAAAGNVVDYHGDDGYEDSQVVADKTDGGVITAGVLQAAPTDGQYCWIQTKGYATLTTALTAGADGNALTSVGAGDNTLDVSALVTDAVTAFAIDASAKLVLLNCPW
jgi:hypothetical protein